MEDWCRRCMSTLSTSAYHEPPPVRDPSSAPCTPALPGPTELALRMSGIMSDQGEVLPPAALAASIAEFKLRSQNCRWAVSQFFWVSLEEHMLGLQGMAFPSCLHIFNQSRDHLQRYCVGKLFYYCWRFNPDSPDWTQEALLCFSTFPHGGPMEVCIFLRWRADCFWEGRYAFFVTA